MLDLREPDGVAKAEVGDLEHHGLVVLEKDVQLELPVRICGHKCGLDIRTNTWHAGRWDGGGRAENRVDLHCGRVDLLLVASLPSDELLVALWCVLPSSG